MRKALETSIDNINNFIYELNKINQRSTPNLNNVLRHYRGKGNHSFKYNMLSDHTAPEQNLGLIKIAIKTESAATWRMNIQSFSCITRKDLLGNF